MYNKIMFFIIFILNPIYPLATKSYLKDTFSISSQSAQDLPIPFLITDEKQYQEDQLIIDQLTLEQRTTIQNPLPHHIDTLPSRLNEIQQGGSLVHQIVTLYVQKSLENPSQEKLTHKLKTLISVCHADLNFSSIYGSPLAIASASIPENKHTLFLLELLLRLGADPNSELNACKLLSYEQATYIHSFFEDFAQETKFSPLELSIIKGNYQSALTLVQYGANVNETVEEGDSIFMTFIQKIADTPFKEISHPQKITSLLDAMLKQNIDVAHQNLRGDTLFHLLNHPVFDEPFKNKFKQKILDHFKDDLQKQTLFLLQNLQGDFIDGHPSPHPTPLLEENPSYTPFGSKRNDELFSLLNHIEKLPHSFDIFLCLSRTCPCIENTRNELKPYQFFDKVKKILFQKLSHENHNPTLFLKHYYDLRIPYDYLILFALSFSQEETPLLSFSQKILSFIKQKQKDLPLSCKASAWLSVCDFSSGSFTFLPDKVAELIIQEKPFVFPLIFMLSPFHAMQVSQILTQKKYLSAPYNLHNVIPRMIELALYKQANLTSLNKKRHKQHQTYIQEITSLFLEMKKQASCLSSINDIISSQDRPFIVKGRSIVFFSRGRQYSIKLKKKNETDTQFLDGAVINWGLHHHDPVFKRQFSPSSYVHLETSLFQDFVSEIQKQDEFKNIELSPFACIIVTEHQQYYDYLFTPQPNKNFPDSILTRQKKLDLFLNGLEQNMRDYSSLAHKNLFLNDLTSNSHGENRHYDYATYLHYLDAWNHGAGAFENLTYGCHISNLGTQGLRDLGNLLFINEDKARFRSNLGNQKFYDLLSPEEKETIFLSDYTQVHMEHLFVHIIMLFTFLENNRLLLADIKDSDFFHIVFSRILQPFLEEHFKKEMSDEEFNNLKKHVSFFMNDLIFRDWYYFRNNPSCIHSVISRDGSRDFPLQNIFTGCARIVNLLNLKDSQMLESLSLWTLPSQTLNSFQETRLEYPYQKAQQLMNEFEEYSSSSDSNLESIINRIHEEGLLWVHYYHSSHTEFLDFFKALEIKKQNRDSHTDAEIQLYKKVLLFYIRSNLSTPFQSLLSFIDRLHISHKVLDLHFFSETILLFKGHFLNFYLPYFDFSCLPSYFFNNTNIELWKEKISDFNECLSLLNYFIQSSHENQPQSIPFLLLLMHPDCREKILHLPQVFQYFEKNPTELIYTLKTFPELKTSYEITVSYSIEPTILRISPQTLSVKKSIKALDFITHFLSQSPQLIDPYLIKIILSFPQWRSSYLSALTDSYEKKATPSSSLIHIMEIAHDLFLFDRHSPILISENLQTVLSVFFTHYPTLQTFYFVYEKYPHLIFTQFNAFELYSCLKNCTTEKKIEFLKYLKNENLNPFIRVNLSHYLSLYFSPPVLYFIIENFHTPTTSMKNGLELLHHLIWKNSLCQRFIEEHVLLFKKAFETSHLSKKLFQEILLQLKSLTLNPRKEVPESVIHQRFCYIILHLLPHLEQDTIEKIIDDIFSYICSLPLYCKQLLNTDSTIYLILKKLQITDHTDAMIHLIKKSLQQEIREQIPSQFLNANDLTERLCNYLKDHWKEAQPYLCTTLGSKKGWVSFFQTLHKHHILLLSENNTPTLTTTRTLTYKECIEYFIFKKKPQRLLTVSFPQTDNSQHPYKVSQKENLKNPFENFILTPLLPLIFPLYYS